MNPPTLVRAVSPRDRAMAERIHAIQMRAYKQEAKLIGATRFPPLERSFVDVHNSPESFIGAFQTDQLVGALSFEPDDEGLGTNIASLVVDPEWQRQGIGRQLLDAFLAHHPGSVTVQTAAKNAPALALYRQLGFTEHRRWFIGAERLELVKLRRHAQGSQGNPHV